MAVMNDTSVDARPEGSHQVVHTFETQEARDAYLAARERSRRPPEELYGEIFRKMQEREGLCPLFE